MKTQSNHRLDRAAIVLAGGKGSRLCSMTRKITGYDVPKQFCNLLGEESLLEHTLRRVSIGIEPRLMVVALTREHERFYGPSSPVFLTRTSQSSRITGGPRRRFLLATEDR
jgi:mannose-1-phosphate guanylyltransferase